MKSLGVGAHTLSNQFDIPEDSAFLAKRSTAMRGKDKISVSSFNPHLMRGSLNCGYRKNEMMRINQGNKVSTSWLSISLLLPIFKEKLSTLIVFTTILISINFSIENSPVIETSEARRGHY